MRKKKAKAQVQAQAQVKIPPTHLKRMDFDIFNFQTLRLVTP
jgi:hypothetical protein